LRTGTNFICLGEEAMFQTHHLGDNPVDDQLIDLLAELSKLFIFQFGAPLKGELKQPSTVPCSDTDRTPSTAAIRIHWLHNDTQRH
jgi:hypothetical protein